MPDLHAIPRFVLPTIAAVLAGAVNAIAGGGSLLTFPALLYIGVPPVVANATNTMALVPGSATAFWTYRRDLRGDVPALVAMTVPSIVGGIAGAVLLLAAGDALFSRLVPWLILAATALFVVQGPLSSWMRKKDVDEEAREHHSTLRLVVLALMQLVVATYGGFFGAGMGIMMLAVLGLAGIRGIHRMNGLKNFAAISINGIAAVTFAMRGKVDWPLATVMAVGAVFGGYAGARIAKRVGARAVRLAIIGIGLTITVVMFVKQLRG